MSQETDTPMNLQDRELMELQKILMLDLHIRNKIKTNITLSEFKKFLPLFRQQEIDIYNSHAQINELELLKKQWIIRVNQFEPINIIDDTTKEVIFIIPNEFTNVKNLADFENGKYVQLPDIFSYMLKLENRPDKIHMVGNQFLEAIYLANKELFDNKEKYKENYDKIASLALSKVRPDLINKKDTESVVTDTSAKLTMVFDEE